MNSTPALPADTCAAVASALERIELEHLAPMLFAVESGSRAWGFASPNSDFDVRFVYARPTTWYVSLTPGRDVLEWQGPGDLDLAGWDARKAILLLLRGNCALREWLRSPLVYLAEPTWLDAFRALADRVPARSAAAHHYHSLARNTWNQHLATSEDVVLKKYLYALRPALALRWLDQHETGEPPMDLPTLLAQVELPREALAELGALLEQKRLSRELGTGQRRPALDALVRAALASPMHQGEALGADVADAALALFRATVAHADARVGRP